MEATQRTLVLEHLDNSRERLLQAVAGLAEEQRAFRPAEDRWSVTDCVEHIIVVERFIFANILRKIETPPQPERRPEVAGKEHAVLTRVPAREIRVKGPDPVMPTGRWPDFEVMLGEFQQTRDRSRAFAIETQACLEDHFFPHPFLGELDCYQWLLFLGTHCERHVRQLEEVKADPGFPKQRSAGISD